MAIATIALTTTLNIVALLLLTTGNGWAVASFAQKYGMGCKSCHTFGSELNDVGRVFKKNGHTFGEKNALNKETLKQGAAKDDNRTTSDPTVKGTDKPGAAGRGNTDGTTSVDVLPDSEKPVPETKVYSWKAEDGTPHFSDKPYVNPLGDKKSASDIAVKKITRDRFKPLSAAIPKRSQKTAAKTTVAKQERTTLSHPASSDSRLSSLAEIRSEARPKSFEECM